MTKYYIWRRSDGYYDASTFQPKLDNYNFEILGVMTLWDKQKIDELIKQRKMKD